MRPRPMRARPMRPGRTRTKRIPKSRNPEMGQKSRRVPMPKKAKKTVEPEAAEIAEAKLPETSETKPQEAQSDAEHTSRLEPGEPELKAASKAGRRKTAGTGKVVAPRKAGGRRKAAGVEAGSETP